MGDLASFARELRALKKALEQAELRKVADRAGVPAQADFAAVASRESFGEWDAPWTTVVKRADTGIVVGPDSAGVPKWVVATVGRNAGGRRGKRWNGRTRGRGTGDEATALVMSNTPDRVSAEVDVIVTKAMGAP